MSAVKDNPANCTFDYFHLSWPNILHGGKGLAGYAPLKMNGHQLLNCMAYKPVPDEEKEIPPEISLVSITTDLPILQQISSFKRLRQVMAWILQFVHNWRGNKNKQAMHKGTLRSNELIFAEEHWIASAQQTAYPKELTILQAGKELCNKQHLPLCPFIDQRGLLRIGGRIGLSQQPYERCHPLIIPSKHILTKIIIRSEHLRLLHASPTLVAASLIRRFHIPGAQRIIHSITRECVVGCRTASKPGSQLHGWLPPDRLNPGPAFHQVGFDYEGPIMVKCRSPRKPFITKAYICVFVLFTVKAVHLEPVSELTTATFIATLQRFMA